MSSLADPQGAAFDVHSWLSQARWLRAHAATLTPWATHAWKAGLCPIHSTVFSASHSSLQTHTYITGYLVCPPGS